MRPGVAIFAAAAVVAATLPFLRDHDDAIIALLGKAKIAVTGGEDEKKDDGVDPPPLTDVDLANLDDRRDVIPPPAHARRTAELTDPEPACRRRHSAKRRRARVRGDDRRAHRTGAGVGELQWRSLTACVAGTTASIFKIVTGSGLVEAGAAQRKLLPAAATTASTIVLEPDENATSTAPPRPAGRNSTSSSRGWRCSTSISRSSTGGASPGWGLTSPSTYPSSRADRAPDEQLEFARAAAGFCTPCHRSGRQPGSDRRQWRRDDPARSWSAGCSTTGNPIYEAPQGRQVLKRVLDERPPANQDDGADGAQRHRFRIPRPGGRPFLPDFGGRKTGTLSSKNPETLITWWVVSPRRQARSPSPPWCSTAGPGASKAHVASDLLRIYFADQGWTTCVTASYRGKKLRENGKAAAAQATPQRTLSCGGCRRAPQRAPAPAKKPRRRRRRR